MELGLKDTVAVVWGAAGGIGAATAAEFASEGARVALVDRDRDALNSLAEKLSGLFATPTLPLVADVTDPASVAAVADQVWDRWGQHQANRAPRAPHRSRLSRSTRRGS